MCDALRGRCAAEEFLLTKPTDNEVDDRIGEVAEDDDLSDDYVNAFLAVLL